MPTIFDKGDKEYFQWMNENPNGFVLNTGRGTKNTAFILHKSQCTYITEQKSFDDKAYTMRDWIKVVANDVTQIVQYCFEKRENFKGDFKLCKGCNPKYTNSPSFYRRNFINVIDKYLAVLKTTNWIEKEAYKFEFANYIHQNINWTNQTDKEILTILINSQNIRYTGKKRGVQFIQKSAKILGTFVSLQDVNLLRKIQTQAVDTIDWSNISMSYTALSAWLASLFPDKFYPIPLKGFNQTIHFLFDYKKGSFPKVGLKYFLQCQSFMSVTERILQERLVKTLYLEEWNKFYLANPTLNIGVKKEFSKLDWVWLVQDFHLFIHRNILGLYGKQEDNFIIQKDLEAGVVEGKSKLAIHKYYERDTKFILDLKQAAIRENKMLNCEACGFSFMAVYGEIGMGFIEAHHKNPLSQQEGHSLTRKEDIALVCSNCHRMLHKGNPVYTIAELKEKITSANSI